LRNKITVVGRRQRGRQLRVALAEKDLADVVLVDVVEGVPQGKGLDLLESGPVQGYDVTITGLERLCANRQFRHRHHYRRLSRANRG